jgi:hypothetical protein
LLARDTSTLHVLTNVPLTAASGKKVVAKEVMVWEGAHCYYCVGSTDNEGSRHGHVGIHGPKGLVEGGEEEVDRLLPFHSGSGANMDDEQEEHVGSGGGAAPKSKQKKKGLAKVSANAKAAEEVVSSLPSPRRRYLAFDGPIAAADLHFPIVPHPLKPSSSSSSSSSASGQQSQSQGPYAANTNGQGWVNVNPLETLAATVLQLVAMAIYTDRILVLPVIYHDGRFIRTWEMLDLISAEQFVEVVHVVGLSGWAGWWVGGWLGCGGWDCGAK